MAYNWEKQTCDDCGISKEEAKKRPPTPTGIKHPVYSHSTSFRLGLNGDVRCAACHRENELKQLFAQIDARKKIK